MRRALVGVATFRHDSRRNEEPPEEDGRLADSPPAVKPGGAFDEVPSAR
jgi:hypothetical protein